MGNKNSKLLLQVDSREQSRIKLAEEYFPQYNYTVKVEQLPCGDYIFNDKVCFEYKTQADFIGSILDNRLFNEAINQLEQFDYHFVIINGSARDLQRAIKETNNHQGFTMKQYYGAIARLNTHTTVLTVPGNINDAFYQMHIQAVKCMDSKPLCKKFDNKDKNPAFNALCYCLNGISSGRANSIVDELDLLTWSDVYHLTQEDLLRVPGIGSKLASNIIKQISGAG